DGFVVGPGANESLDLGFFHAAATTDETQQGIEEALLFLPQRLELLELELPPGGHARMLADQASADNFPRRRSASATVPGLGLEPRLRVLVMPGLDRFLGDHDLEVLILNLCLAAETRGRANVEGLVEDVLLPLRRSVERLPALDHPAVAARARSHAAADAAHGHATVLGRLRRLEDGGAGLDLHGHAPVHERDLRHLTRSPGRSVQSGPP